MRKRPRPIILQNPFSLYVDMFSAGMQVTELVISSGKVIAHRSDMIARAMNGELPLHHKEFTDMWLEKIFAGGESMAAAMKHMDSFRSGTPSLHGLMEIIAPYRKKAASNAKRLKKR